MGVLRDLFDMFMQIRKIKDDKRKDYFNNVVLKTYDQLRTVHENFLTVFAECIEMSEATGDVQEVIKHLRTSRPRMQTIRQEIYEKTRAYLEDHKEARDFLVLKFDQEENEEVMDFLLSCLEYFEIRNHYSHDLGNMLSRLESVSVDLVSSESYDARRKAIRYSNYRRTVPHIRREFEFALKHLSYKWRRVARAFAKAHRHFV